MRKGFTLVELIIVVIIIGILASVGIPQFRRALERARGASAYAALGHIQEAEKLHFVTNENYLACADVDAACQASLDIVIPSNIGWSFAIVSPTTTTFTATATRTAGPCNTETVSIDQTGTMTDAWRTCVDTL